MIARTLKAGTSPGNDGQGFLGIRHVVFDDFVVRRTIHCCNMLTMFLYRFEEARVCIRHVVYDKYGPSTSPRLRNWRTPGSQGHQVEIC